MSKENYDKILLACKNNKNICISMGQFVDLLKSAFIGEYEMIGFKPIADKELLETGLYAKINETNCYVSCIVGPENIRISKLANPIAAISALRKNGDKKVNETIAANWSEEMPLATYGQ
jgi:hypothetical protein